MKILNSISDGSQSVAKLYRRSLHAIAFCVILCLSGQAHGAEPYAGLLIYMEPPIGSMKIPEALPYARIERKGSAVSDVVLVTGKTREILNGGILAVLQMNSAAASKEVVGENASAMVRKYPGVRPAVEDFLTRSRQASAVAQKSSALPHSPTGEVQIVVGGSKFIGATLEAVTGEAAKIMHSDGVATLPLAALTNEQIALLNTTSTSVRIDPNWLERKRLADAENEKRRQEEASEMVNDPTSGSAPPQPVTGKPSTPSSRAMGGDAAVAAEEFGALPAPAFPVEPSVDETVAFINAKLAAAVKYHGQAFRLGYVTSIGKWVLRTFK